VNEVLEIIFKYNRDSNKYLLWEMESVKEFGKEFESLDYKEKKKLNISIHL